jgi:hypothetical protein
MLGRGSKSGFSGATCSGGYIPLIVLAVPQSSGVWRGPDGVSGQRRCGRRSHLHQRTLPAWRLPLDRRRPGSAWSRAGQRGQNSPVSVKPRVSQSSRAAPADLWGCGRSLRFLAALRLISDSPGMPSPSCKRGMIWRVNGRPRSSISCTRLPAADEGDEFPRGKPILLHVIFDRLDRVWHAATLSTRRDRRMRNEELMCPFEENATALARFRDVMPPLNHTGR